MKNDYSAIFRNIRTTRSLPDSRYKPHEAAWVPWVGGFVAGCFFAFMLYLGV